MNYLKIKKLIFCLLVLSLFFNCGCIAQPNSTKQVINLYRDYPAFSGKDNVVNCIIEIPAGDKEKWETNTSTGKLELPLVNGKPKINRYALAYPFNYGMIPQTLVSKKRGGDGDPADIVVLGRRLERASLQRARVLGILHTLDKERIDDKVIGVINDDDNFSGISSLEDLDTKFPQVLEIVKIWFKNYKLNTAMQVGDFSAADKALEFINLAARDYQKKQFNKEAEAESGGN